MSACHAGRLADNPTPVGSGRFREQTRDAQAVPGLVLSLLIQSVGQEIERKRLTKKAGDG